MEKIIKTSNFARKSLNNEEKRIFNAIKREILSEIAVPKNTDFLMIDVIALEYVKYIRATTANMPRVAISSAKAMREYMSELNLTPKSRTETNTSSTLSTIFKVLNQGDANAEHQTEI